MQTQKQQYDDKFDIEVADDDRKAAAYHYDRHRDVYAVVEARLSETRERYETACESVRLSMLRKAFAFAALSVQTPVDRHEAAYRELWRGDGPDADGRIESALQEVNYRNQKAEYLREFFADTDLQRRVDAALRSGDKERALRVGYDEMKGVGTVKVPFMYAILGFTEYLCVDGNISYILDMDGYPQTQVPEKYMALTDRVLAEFPALASNLDPFMVQWVLFDYVRGGRQWSSEAITLHTSWFESVGVV